MKKIVALPSMECEFEIDVQGSETDQNFKGIFKYKRLTLGKRMEAAKMKCKLSEDLKTLPDDVLMYNEMVSELRYGIIEYPDWWKNSNFGLDLYDVNIITALYKEIQNFENEWEEKVYKNKEEKNK